jgi:hypothetical protein
MGKMPDPDIPILKQAKGDLQQCQKVLVFSGKVTGRKHKYVGLRIKLLWICEVSPRIIYHIP